jgi:hypothetical protein
MLNVMTDPRPASRRTASDHQFPVSTVFMAINYVVELPPCPALTALHLLIERL